MIGTRSVICVVSVEENRRSLGTFCDDSVLFDSVYMIRHLDSSESGFLLFSVLLHDKIILYRRLCGFEGIGISWSWILKDYKVNHLKWKRWVRHKLWSQVIDVFQVYTDCFWNFSLYLPLFIQISIINKK